MISKTRDYFFKYFFQNKFFINEIKVESPNIKRDVTGLPTNVVIDINSRKTLSLTIITNKSGTVNKKDNLVIIDLFKLLAKNRKPK